MHDFCWASHFPTKAMRPWRRCHRWRMEHWNLMLRRCWRRRLCPRWGFFLGWKGWEVHEIWGLNHEGHVGGRLGPCWGQVGALMGPYWGHGLCGGRGGLCWGNVWAKLRARRAMWRHLGAMSRLLSMLGQLGARWLGAVQKTVKHSIFCHSPCWCQDGPCWGLLKQSWTCWGRVGAKLGPSWAHVGLGACGDNRAPPVQHRVFYRSAVGSQDRWCWDFWGSTWAMLVAISGDALCRWASWAHEPFLANVGPKLRPFHAKMADAEPFVLAVLSHVEVVLRPTCWDLPGPAVTL